MCIWLSGTKNYFLTSKYFMCVWFFSLVFRSLAHCRCYLVDVRYNIHEGYAQSTMMTSAYCIQHTLSLSEAKPKKSSSFVYHVLLKLQSIFFRSFHRFWIPCICACAFSIYLIRCSASQFAHQMFGISCKYDRRIHDITEMPIKLLANERIIDWQFFRTYKHITLCMILGIKKNRSIE